MSMDNSCNVSVPDGLEQCVAMAHPEDMLRPWVNNPEFVPIMITHALSFIIGAIGNVIIITIMTRDKSSRNATSMFLVSLAVADLLLLVVCIPLELLQYFVVTWDEEGAVCKLSSYGEMVSAVASVLNLTAVSLERYVVIVYPMKSRSFCTMSNCRRALFLVWIVALILAIPVTITRGTVPFTFYNNHTDITITIYYCWDGEDGGLPFVIAVYQLCIMFILPCLLMIFCYSRVIKELWMSTKAVSAMTRISSRNFDSRISISSAMRNSLYHSPSSSNSLLRNSSIHHPKPNQSDDVRQARKQVIKMLILVIVLFLVCWGPRVIMHVFIKYGLTLYSPIIYSIRVACMQLPFVHSCLNPIIYSLMSSNFRRILVRSCRRNKSCYHVFCCCVNDKHLSNRRALPSSTSANYELTFNSEMVRTGHTFTPSTCSTMCDVTRTSPICDKGSDFSTKNWSSNGV